MPVTTFAPIATGGVNQQPITSFVYENIGVNIDILPRLHHDDEVSLTLKLALSSISGTGFGGLPTFGNREITTTIRLKDGETNMLAGLIRDEERTVLAGVPGPERYPAHRPPVRQQSQGDAADRHRPDADAAHRPRAGPDGRRPAAVPAGPRLGERRRRCCRRCRIPRDEPINQPMVRDPTPPAGAAARPRSRRSRSRCSRPLPVPAAVARSAPADSADCGRACRRLPAAQLARPPSPPARRASAAARPAPP